jgi:outer membrane autotransporter protein
MGVKWSRMIQGKGSMIFTPEVRAFYTREFADGSASVRTAFRDVQDVSFVADSGKWGRNSGQLGIGLNTQVSQWFNIRFDYDCEVYNHTSSNLFTASLGAKW